MATVAISSLVNESCRESSCRDHCRPSLVALWLVAIELQNAANFRRHIRATGLVKNLSLIGYQGHLSEFLKSLITELSQCAINGQKRERKRTTLLIMLHLLNLSIAKQTTYRSRGKADSDIMLHFKGENAVTSSRPAGRVPGNAMQHLEPAEVLSVLKAAKTKGSREWAMIIVAYKHGMRASEVCNLRVDDVDLKNGSIVIERLKGSLRTTQAVTEHRGEPLLNERRALREWLRERRNDGSDYLFTSQKGGRLDRSQFFRLFRAIACEAGLAAEKRHPHALKHSLASHLVLANVNLALVKQQLGHKSIGSTMRYVTISDQQASKATANALMEIF
jgi:integrase